MKNETMAKLKARLFPANKETCIKCKRSNAAGEHFGTRPGWNANRLCPECMKAIIKIRNDKQTELYVSGKETPDDVDKITCPWCGYEDRNSGECADSDDEHECGECGGIFSYERDVIVTYSSERVSPPEPDKEDKEA